MRTAPVLGALSCAVVACSGTRAPRGAATPEGHVPEHAAASTQSVAVPAPAAQASSSEPTNFKSPGPGTRTLDVPGFDAALVSLPSGDVARQPVLIAAHGAGDNPAWQCEAWRAVLGDRAVILCLSGPREYPRSEGRYFPDHFALERITFASLEALRRVLPDSARAARVVYTGYSQGATMGALMIVDHGDSCPRLALVEGGFDGWTVGRAEKFKRSGGERVLFACGTGYCRKRAETSARTLEKAGVEARVVADLSGGHDYGGAVARAVKESFAWLVEGDANWNPEAAAPPP